jgi:hypothetical protein
MNGLEVIGRFFLAILGIWIGGAYIRGLKHRHLGSD